MPIPPGPKPPNMDMGFIPGMPAKKLIYMSCIQFATKLTHHAHHRVESIGHVQHGVESVSGVPVHVLGVLLRRILAGLILCLAVLALFGRVFLCTFAVVGLSAFCCLHNSIFLGSGGLIGLVRFLGLSVLRML